MDTFPDQIAVLHGEEDKESSNESVSDGSSQVTTLSSSLRSSDAALRHSSSENKAVRRSRMLMFLVFTLLATVSSVGVFKSVQHQEQKGLQQKFEEYATQVVAVYEVNSKKILDIYTTFSMSISASTMGTQSEWPFVNIPAFEAKASEAMAQSGATSMGVAHIVRSDQLDAWANWTAAASQDWQGESYAYQGIEDTPPQLVMNHIWGNIADPAPQVEPVGDHDFFMPFWQTSPVNPSVQNLDALSWTPFADEFDHMMKLNGPSMSAIYNYGQKVGDNWGDNWPESFITVPVFDKVSKDRKTLSLVGVVSSLLPWHSYFLDLLPEGVEGLILVISNTCNQTVSYEIQGPTISYLGTGDVHDIELNLNHISTSISPFKQEPHCAHTLDLYPSKSFVAYYSSSHKAIVYAAVVIAMFLVMAVVFLVYDCFVKRRQNKVVSTAERSTAIVASLFPKQVATRLMEEKAEAHTSTRNAGFKKTKSQGDSTWMLKSTRNGSTEMNMKKRDSLTSKPIAELFPSATVFFADIVGFTAWSSEREPEQVFELLEQIYASFDRVAKKRKVFKVETIGDCYMAASGIPEKRKDHAVTMARFARDCVLRMHHVLRRLEVTLGPETSELGIRVGIHSGPVTAGVLRGDKARFQLFGDTVNTAARMESTGLKNKIQMSSETATAIQAASVKDIWTVPRDTPVEAKGKGTMQTYWLESANRNQSDVSSQGIAESLRSDFSMSIAASDDEDEDEDDHDGECLEDLLKDNAQTKLDRTIEWSVDVLQRLLKQVVAMRGGIEHSRGVQDSNFHAETAVSPLEEVLDIIPLPGQQLKYKIHPGLVQLPPQVVFQLRDYVRSIASMYRRNPFHNFPHATHVTQSVVKLLSRVVAPNSSAMLTGSKEDIMAQDHAELHRYTYGITSDPLTQFAVAFSALIHDVDHPGVPNATLVEERSVMAQAYCSKSVAEQNSVDLAWNLLWEPCYKELRACIFVNEDEYRRFRQLVVNAVMATDIVDKELGAARKKRWTDAFSSENRRNEDPALDSNRKATIVIEHLIQASDVAHTMQHWHVYLKWNERFFWECYKGFLDGRTKEDPSKNWYKGELGFFDFYVIPLAKKLKECAVFGVSSDEYLQYAQANRSEWESKGEELLEGYIQQFTKRLQKRTSSR